MSGLELAFWIGVGGIVLVLLIEWLLLRTGAIKPHKWEDD